MVVIIVEVIGGTDNIINSSIMNNNGNNKVHSNVVTEEGPTHGRVPSAPLCVGARKNPHKREQSVNKSLGQF